MVKLLSLVLFCGLPSVMLRQSGDYRGLGSLGRTPCNVSSIAVASEGGFAVFCVIQGRL